MCSGQTAASESPSSCWGAHAAHVLGWGGLGSNRGDRAQVLGLYWTAEGGGHRRHQEGTGLLGRL